MDLRLLRYFVAVVEERNIGRAADRLHMTQPPLSRAVKQLEADLGTILLTRTTAGVEPTAAGRVLFDEALTLLAHADEVTARVGNAATRVLRLGTLADTAARTGPDIAARFLREHPDVDVTTRESDFNDPSAGLRHGWVDVALTRLPFDVEGLHVQRLQADPVGVVTRDDDPLAGRDDLVVEDLRDRTFARFPDGADPAWQDYWCAGLPVAPDAPAVRTSTEFLQVVLWGRGIGIAPIDVRLPAGLAVTSVLDLEPSWLALVWRRDTTDPLVREFARAAADVYPLRRRVTRPGP